MVDVFKYAKIRVTGAKIERVFDRTDVLPGGSKVRTFTALGKDCEIVKRVYYLMPSENRAPRTRTTRAHRLTFN